MDEFHRLFFASAQEIWASLAEQIGGTYTEGGWWKTDRIEAKHGGWVIVLDTYNPGRKNAPCYTRFRTAFVNPDSFHFAVKRAGFFSDIAARLGHPDLEVGVPEFDRLFAVKANNADKARLLFADQTLRSLMLEYPDVLLSVGHDDQAGGKKLPFGTDELRLLISEMRGFEPPMREAFEIFAHTLDRLCQMGSAAKGDPGVQL